jgi:hypothetical protein
MNELDVERAHDITGRANLFSSLCSDALMELVDFVWLITQESSVGIFVVFSSYSLLQFRPLIYLFVAF